jgi:hypothetical protein
MVPPKETYFQIHQIIDLPGFIHLHGPPMGVSELPGERIKLLLSQGSRFSPQIIFNAGRFGRENIIHWADFLFSLEGCLDNFPFNEKITSTFLEYC